MVACSEVRAEVLPVILSLLPLTLVQDVLASMYTLFPASMQAPLPEPRDYASYAQEYLFDPLLMQLCRCYGPLLTKVRGVGHSRVHLSGAVVFIRQGSPLSYVHAK